MKFEFIFAHKEEHTILKMCEVLGVSRSGYYTYLKRKANPNTKRAAQKKKIQERIQFHFIDSMGTYGSPRIHRKLIKEGFIISQKTVANMMRDMGLFATMPRKFTQTTDSNHHNKVYKNKLNQNFNPSKPNKAWATDITYVHTGEGFIYLNPVMDLFSRKIISYSIDDTMDQSLSITALQSAIDLRKPGEDWIHHSDRGAQYTSNQYIEILKKEKAEISMSRTANPYDNACLESFFATLKKEYLYKFVFKTKAEAAKAIELYIDFYNRKRIHSSLGYVSPIDYELAYYWEYYQSA